MSEENVMDTEDVTVEDGTSDTPIEDSGDTQVETEEVEYTPNFTYKVKDEERSFDERFHGIVRSKDDEDFIRDLYTKADGLESYKTKLTEKEQAYTQLHDQASQLSQGFQTIKQHRDNGDFDKLTKAIGWKEEDLLNYAYKIAQERALPQEEQKRLQAERQRNDEVASLRAEIDTMKTSQQEKLLNQQIDQVSAEMNKYPEMYKEFEARGTSFGEMVIALGRNYKSMHGKDPDIGELVKTVVKQAMGANYFDKTTQSADSEEQLPIINTRKPTLANVKQGNTNPVDETIDMAKLRQMASEIAY